MIIYLEGRASNGKTTLALAIEEFLMCSWGRSVAHVQGPEYEKLRRKVESGECNTLEEAAGGRDVIVDGCEVQKVKVWGC